MRNWIFVRVETDQPGLIGWGEATLEWKTRGVVGAIQDLEPLLIGKDPRDIENCYQIMTRHSFWRMGALGMSAISGIEIALWDIFGKSCGMPVWRLLGGKTRDYLRTYTHLDYGEMESVYESDNKDSVVAKGMDVGISRKSRAWGSRSMNRSSLSIPLFRTLCIHAMPSVPTESF